MIDKLIIVESPAKAKTIGKFLGAGFVVKSSMGHIRDLPRYTLGVDVTHDFQPSYVVPREKQKTVKELSSLAKSAKNIYIATDEDREGEAIGWHIVATTKADRDKVSRIVFHEITKEVIEAALSSPRAIDMSLVNAQQARRILDRLVGYKISPLLGKKIYSGLSAGRVQSVALRFIVEREREIEQFVPQEYWVIKAELKKREFADAFFAQLVGKGNKKFDKLEIKNQDEAQNILRELEQAHYVVEKIVRKEVKRNPSPPFITSTLQQEAFRKLGFSAKKTMVIAQQLYEGVDLREKGVSGLITYMRTDSLNVSHQAQDEARAYILERYGQPYVPAVKRVYKTKVKGAQEAHEAIRPTAAGNIPDKIKTFLTPEQFKLYALIWQRFLASQMTSALFDTVTVDLRAKDYLFRASGQTLKFDGFMVLYIESEESDKKDETPEAKKKLPMLEEKEIVELIRLLSEQKFTEPPPRFNEASLIKTLEKYGIGRPSTYAPIISTLLFRKYVKIAEGKFYPEKIGIMVNDILKTHFPDVIDVAFTAQMEGQLDEIAAGKKNWVQVLGAFYASFTQTLEKAAQQIKTIKTAEPTGEMCPQDNASLVIRNGRFGRFIACSNYPRCTYTADIEPKKKPPVEMTEEKCEKCGKSMVVRIGKRGKFLACSGYPLCKNTKPLPKTKE